MNNYFATCPKGLENLLFEEITAMGASSVRQTVAGVSFKGDLAEGYKAALWSRFASRILLKITDFHASDDFELYLGTNSVSWENYFDFNKTIAIDFSGTSESIKNTLYGAQKVKDAIVDHFSKKFGSRPSVDKDNPDVRIVAHLDRRQSVSLSFDITGSSMHKRTYRTKAGAAPLKENLAAAIVARANASGSVVDPMCGSGTILIEAAMRAANYAPGLLRKNIGFSNLKIHDQALWDDILNNARQLADQGFAKLRSEKIRFHGFDQDQQVVDIAQENVERAGFSEFIDIETCDLNGLKNPFEQKVCSVITNPPYGERLGNFTELLDLYTVLGNKLKSEFPGCTATVISSNSDLLSCINLRADKTYRLFNGALECQLKFYKISYKKNADQNSLTSAEAPKVDVLKVAQDFANRLTKNIKGLSKWIESEGLEAYRIYDADLPDYNAAIDIYANYTVIQEYAAPKSVSMKTAHERLLNMMLVTRNILGFPGEHIIVKRRERQKGDEQYQKLDDQNHTMTIHEYGAKYIVNLEDYLDTGVFNDHRLVRKLIRTSVSGKDFLNVFAYTGTATVQAALGGAKTTTTVDMSKTYLNWAKDNLRVNNFNDHRVHKFEQADCLKWIKNCKQQFDFIFADPPTFSNSKRMEDTFDIQRDHITLLTDLRVLLRENGQILFSNNRKNFKLDYEQVGNLGFKIIDLSKSTLSKDYTRAQALHNCWLLTLENKE